MSLYVWGSSLGTAHSTQRRRQRTQNRTSTQRHRFAQSGLSFSIAHRRWTRSATMPRLFLFNRRSRLSRTRLRARFTCPYGILGRKIPWCQWIHQKFHKIRLSLHRIQFFGTWHFHFHHLQHLPTKATIADENWFHQQYDARTQNSHRIYFVGFTDASRRISTI